ncbi:hypothetical protein Hanom_Chr17g01543451 [Helianthus anomalus]
MFLYGNILSCEEPIRDSLTICAYTTRKSTKLSPLKVVICAAKVNSGDLSPLRKMIYALNYDIGFLTHILIF